MKMIGLIRLGKDAETKNVGDTQVMQVVGAFDVGYGANKETSWINLSMFGSGMDKRAQYLKKGSMILIDANDVRVRTYQKKDGSQGFSLEARLQNFEFAGARSDAQQAGNDALNTARQQKPSAQPDLDDDIPF